MILSKLTQFQPNCLRILCCSLILFVAHLDLAHASCSGYADHATINEVSIAGGSSFVEIKLLDASISQGTWSGWSLSLCTSSGSCHSFSLSTATDNSPWLVLDTNPIGSYIDLKKGMDAILKDASGNTIDYLSVNGYTGQQDTNCNLSFPTTITGTSASTKTIARIPDGTGSWAQPGPGNSIKPTQGGNNTTAPGGGAAVVVSVNNVSVNKGQNAVFSFTIPSAQSYNISVNYQTQNNTAVAGVDYTASSGVVTIPAGSTSSSASIATLATSTSGQVSFYLFVYNPQNASLTNNYPTGTILASSMSLDHIEIDHTADALTCEPASVTLRACANSSCSSIYTGNVNLTLSPTGWVGGDTVTFSGGADNLQLQHTSAGTVSLAVVSSAPNAINGTSCLDTSTSGTGCNVTFHDSGFIYTVPAQTSCQVSNSITIHAVRMDNTTQQCGPVFVGQTRKLNFSLAYSNPNTGTYPLLMNYNGTNYTITSSGVSVPISFDSNGQAQVNLTYNDAGQISLNSQYLGSAATGDAGLVMNGSASFVTAPAKLYVYSNAANSDCASASPSCTPFTHAGEPFDLKIRAACANNNVTPNFQLSGISISQTNVAPAISQGTLGVTTTDIVASDKGEHDIPNESVSEVGAFTFTATPPASGYFGQSIGSPSLNTSTILGRFTPDHFCVTTTNLINRSDPYTASGCTDNFSYLGEEFTVATTLTAQTYGSACVASGITKNYSGSWSQFSNPLVENTTIGNEKGKWNYAAVNNPGNSPIDLSARLQINTTSSTGNFSNGQASLLTLLKVIRNGTAPNYTAETPFTNVHIGMNPVDNDGIGLGTSNLVINGQNYDDVGSTALYFGRLIAENAYGSNDPSTPLDMYAYTQYCNTVANGACTDWQAKTDDSCTLYNISPPTDTALGLNAANDGLGGYYQRANPTVSTGTYNFNNIGSSPGYARVFVPDTSGHSAGWRLFYTGTGNGGNYTIPFSFPFNTSDPSQHPYLLHQNGIASFGQYRGDDRIIFWREILQ